MYVSDLSSCVCVSCCFNHTPVVVLQTPKRQAPAVPPRSTVSATTQSPAAAQSSAGTQTGSVRFSRPAHAQAAPAASGGAEGASSGPSTLGLSTSGSYSAATPGVGSYANRETPGYGLEPEKVRQVLDKVTSIASARATQRKVVTGDFWLDTYT